MLTKTFEFEIEPVSPYNFNLTINKHVKQGGINWYFITPYEVRKTDEVWTGLMLNEKYYGVKLKFIGRVENPRIVCSVFSKERISNMEEKDLENIIRCCLGTEININDFYQLANEHPSLKEAVQAFYGMRSTAFPDIFSGAILAIMLQRASYGRTEKMLEKFYLNYGQKIVFDNKSVIACPNPRKILETSHEELKAKCKVGYRAYTLKAFAEALNSKKAPKCLAKIENFREVEDFLLNIKGIGKYSVEVILFGVFPCFPIDNWSSQIFSKAFKLEAKDSDSIKNFVVRNFGAWQTYVYDYLVNYYAQN